MNNQFAGKKLLVIGGTSGMGLETARMILEQGGQAVIVGHRADKAESARTELSSLGSVEALTADLTTDEGMQALLKVIDEKHSDVDLLVNAAGVFFPKPFLEHGASDYDQSMQVNSDFSRTAVLKTCQYQWVQSTQPGVERVMLDRIGKEKARATSIVRYLPGSLFPTHTHPGGEEIFVLSGTFSDQSGDYPQGWYLRNPPGSSHAPSSPEGTTIFVKLWQMQPTDQHVVRINTKDPANWTVENGRSICHLYRNSIESTSLQKLSENENLFSAKACHVTSELLVLSGSVSHNDIEYIEGSWLRLAKSDLQSVKAGNLGATVYLKVGEFQNVSHEVSK